MQERNPVNLVNPVRTKPLIHQPHQSSHARRILRGVERDTATVLTFRNPVKKWIPYMRFNTTDTVVYFENVRSGFDSPGEWLYDAKSRRILYRPLPGEKIDAVRALVPSSMSSRLVEFRGSPGKQAFVHDIVFRGIVFEGSAATNEDGPCDKPSQSYQRQAAPNGAASEFSGWIIQTLHLVGVELEKVGDDFGFGRVGRKAVGGKHGAEKIGAMEFVQSMLIQCDHGFVKVFPNWTGADAKFENLRAKGCFLVSAEMKDGKVVRVEVKSEKGGRFRLVDPSGRGTRPACPPPSGWTRGKTRNSNEPTLERDFKPGERVLLW